MAEENEEELEEERRRPADIQSLLDGLLAATALHYNLTVVSRNTADFTHAQVQVLNPWKADDETPAGSSSHTR